MTDQIPPAHIEPARQSLMDRVSIVWVIPVAALLIALGIAWHSYSQRGAMIEISFDNASGIVAGQTELRYREVSVGLVEDVTFSEDLTQVIAHVRVDKDIEDFVDSDSVFWVVSPEVSLRGVTGLNTVLSGVYIEGSWNSVPGGLHRKFQGLANTPLAPPDQTGTRIVLTTNTGRGLKEGTSIMFKGLEVGRVGRPQLSPDGISVLADAFVAAPHDKLLTSRTRFWDTSGFSLSIGPGGASLDFESLSSIVTGGVSFETLVSGGVPVQDGQTFSVFNNREDAQGSLFESADGGRGTVRLSVVFDENITGLKVGAPVMLSGLEIGKVESVTGAVDPELFGDERVRLVVVISIELDQIAMGSDAVTEDQEVIDFLEQRVDEGLRAQLSRASLLTGGLRIDLVEVPDAPAAQFLRDASPYPILPSIPAEISGVASSAEGLIKRVTDLPIEDILQSAKRLLDNAANLVASPDLQQTPAELRGLVTDLRTLVGSAQFQALPGQIDTIAGTLETLLSDLQDSNGVQKLVTAVEKAGQAAGDVGTAFTTMPQLIDEITAVAAKANALDFDALLNQVTGLADSARSVLDDDATRALPQNLSSALAQVTDAAEKVTVLMQEAQDAGTVATVSEAVASAGKAADDVSAAFDGVPELIQSADAIVAKVEAMDLDRLAASVNDLVDSANALIGTDDAKALPASVNAALDEVSAALAELREGGTVTNVNEALAATREAADAVASATNDLPALVAQAEAVLRTAQQTLAGLSDTGALNREAREALRQVSRAADSVSSLARMLERKPNALLTGR
ncbi:MlaD family protein [Tropicimonas sp. IMCC34043]|uniref:MlaD family protein n=1 Tax=Tropicimonas sp. IMCC34043 TaxID=2248760 RepID=UPI000E225A97|nr:MlaD family protein [Tropicimonas sp. IMCC34043]